MKTRLLTLANLPPRPSSRRSAKSSELHARAEIKPRLISASPPSPSPLADSTCLSYRTTGDTPALLVRPRRYFHASFKSLFCCHVFFSFFFLFFVGGFNQPPQTLTMDAGCSGVSLRAIVCRRRRRPRAATALNMLARKDLRQIVN